MPLDCRLICVLALLLGLAALAAPAWGQESPPSPSDAPAFAPPPVSALVIEEVLPIEPLPRPYEWYDIYYWMPPNIWSGSFELGINGSEGNAQSFSMRLGSTLKRKTDWDQFEAKLTHAKTSSGGVIKQNNALFNAREELFLGETPWSVFGTTFLEYDEFKNFDLRIALNTGLGYKFLDEERVKFKGRFGAGTSHEIGGVNDEWVPEGLFGVDTEVKISARQKLTGTIDYFPDWQDFSNYRMITNLGWEWLLDETTNMHLKVAVIHRYDSTPEGREPEDVDYSIMLMWKI
jgi:putative salt-induced outer membrane protein YdiY